MKRHDKECEDAGNDERRGCCCEERDRIKLLEAENDLLRERMECMEKCADLRERYECLLTSASLEEWRGACSELDSIKVDARAIQHHADVVAERDVLKAECAEHRALDACSKERVLFKDRYEHSMRYERHLNAVAIARAETDKVVTF